jgi:hypothetical protein
MLRAGGNAVVLDVKPDDEEAFQATTRLCSTVGRTYQAHVSALTVNDHWRISKSPAVSTDRVVSAARAALGAAVHPFFTAVFL